jgi:hypothetical protein
VFQSLSEVVAGASRLGLGALLDLLLFGVDNPGQDLVIRDLVQAFIITAKS